MTCHDQMPTPLSVLADHFHAAALSLPACLPAPFTATGFWDQVLSCGHQAGSCTLGDWTLVGSRDSLPASFWATGFWEVTLLRPGRHAFSRITLQLVLAFQITSSCTYTGRAPGRLLAGRRQAGISALHAGGWPQPVPGSASLPRFGNFQTTSGFRFPGQSAPTCSPQGSAQHCGPCLTPGPALPLRPAVPQGPGPTPHGQLLGCLGLASLGPGRLFTRLVYRTHLQMGCRLD